MATRQVEDKGDEVGSRGSVRLVPALRRILRPGLPVMPGRADPELLRLPSVLMRSADAADPISNARALDTLLRSQLAQLANPRLAQPAAIMFGAAREVTGANLTARRVRAAAVAGFEVHHFRKRVEPRILGLLSWQLLRDAEDCGSIPAAAPALIPVLRRPPVLPQDVFAWEAVEHEEQLLAIWACLYAGRATLLTCERLRSMESPGTSLAQVAVHALWTIARLVVAANRYQAAYGPTLLHSDASAAPEVLIQLCGWTPRLTLNEQALLAAAGASASFDLFLRKLEESVAGKELIGRWQAEILL